MNEWCIKKLIILADNLDSNGFYKEADYVDFIIKESAKKKSKAKKKKEASKDRKPTKPDLWSRAKSEAKKKYSVWPSAYAVGWALKWYKERGGGWKGKKPIK